MQVLMVMLEEFAKKCSLIIIGVSAMIEAMIYQFFGEYVPMTLDKCTTVRLSDGSYAASMCYGYDTADAGVVSPSDLVWWNRRTPSQTESPPLTKS